MVSKLELSSLLSLYVVKVSDCSKGHVVVVVVVVIVLVEVVV